MIFSIKLCHQTRTTDGAGPVIDTLGQHIVDNTDDHAPEGVEHLEEAFHLEDDLRSILELWDNITYTKLSYEVVLSKASHFAKDIIESACSIDVEDIVDQISDERLSLIGNSVEIEISTTLRDQGSYQQLLQTVDDDHLLLLQLDDQGLTSGEVSLTAGPHVSDPKHRLAAQDLQLTVSLYQSIHCKFPKCGQLSQRSREKVFH